MTTNITQKLKPNIKLEEIQQANGIFCCMNDVFISGDNQRCHSFMTLPKNG